MRLPGLAVALLMGCAAATAWAQAPDVSPPPGDNVPAAIDNAVPPVDVTPPKPDAVPPPAAMPPPAIADSVPPPPPSVAPPAVPAPPQRYSLNRVDGGFLRLDSVSGQMSFCAPRAMGWTCQAVPEDRVALETEISRLQDEVAKLKGEIAALREPPPPPRPPAELTPAPKSGEPAIKLPSSEDLERARAIIEDAWRKIVDMIDAMRKDVMRKGQQG